MIEQREIKFKSYYIWQIDFKSSKIDAKKGDIYTCYKTLNCMSHCLDREKISPELQYIGRKDKNGKEIYEGDIIRAWKSMDTFDKDMKMIEGYATADIKSDGWSFYFDQITGSDWFFYGPESQEFYIDESTGEYEWCEVIGNIYENPELLEGRN